ncbi:MAG: phage tail tape measure protein [Candidatus Excrementavichristensenella sp.]|jgi:TP901 family phage tail tape measure protein
MAETLRELVVALSLDSSNFSRNMRTINQQIKEAESTFRLAGAGVQNYEKTIAGTEAKLSMLGQKLTQQQRAVEQYSRALVAANDKLKENYDRHQDYTQRLEQAKARQEDLRFEVEAATYAYENYRDSLGETDSATIAARQNLERYQEEYADATAEVTKLEGQVKALQKTMQNSADAVSKATTDLNNAKAAVKDTEAEIRRLTEQLYRMQSAWTQAGEFLTAISKKCETISKAMTKAGKSLTTHVTAPITALGTAAIKASVDYEYAFANVRKTVDATEEEYNRLSDSVKQMSTEVAASAEDIAEVMSIAGQLGIENEHLADFTRTMIDLGNSTNMVAADAASEAARFANIMGMSQNEFQNLGSTLVDLGNNYATTESEIMSMSLRLAGAGRQVGLSEAQILGFAAALSSVGIESQMGGSAFSKALIKMEVAAATGGDALEDFARVSGMSASQFKDLWERDAASAFQAFIVGLSKMDEEGVSAIKTLDDIGIAEIRLRDTLLRATNASELFNKTQATANKAWSENAALTNEANKRYATTKSRLTNLKNTALMFARQIGDDLNPTIQQIIDKAGELLQKFLSLDKTQRESIVKWAAFAAAVGPVVLVLGKVVGAVGTVTGALGKAFTAIGKFSASVSMAGGGIGGFVKVLASSKVAMVALAAALVYGAVKLVDVASGAKAAREALEGMAKTAKSWKETAAETFYGSSQGLSFFGMSKDDFKRATGNSREWLNGLLDVWSDGKKETNDIVSEWTESFKSLTASTREELTSLKETADQAGYSSVSAQLQADIDTLDSMDKEIARLLKKKQNRKLSERDKVRLQELIDTREAIEVKYHLSAADTDGFDTIRNKVEAEVARAEARGQEVSATVYENAMVAAAEGMSAVNTSLDEQYDKEYALIQLIENSAERQQALDALNAKYNSDRRAAAMEYAQLMADVVMPVWQQSDIQTAKTQVGDLMQLLRQYSAASTDAEKKSFLPQLNQLTSSMDEGALTEYVALLTQIQSLLDSGMSESEVQAMFPDIDFSSALEQLAAIQTYLNQNKWDTNLTSLNEMFGEAVGEEVLKITTDLDMTGAQARWNEWASNPGAITTDAVIQGYTEAENATKQQPLVDAFVAKYTEQPEGADKSSLTPAGLVAYVQTYAEATTGTDVSGLNPTNVTAMVSAYKELASGTDVTQLKPSEITAYVFKYLEDNKVDTTGLTPEAVTAFVMAYEEVTGGASTAALKPSDVVGLITKYAEAENVDVSALTSAQVEGIVTKFAEATGCDKSELLREFTAYITEYKEAAGVKKPTLNMQVGLSGYDLLAYRRWLRNNKVEVEGVVRLSEVYEDPSGVLGESGVKYWKDGEEIPVTAVTSDMLRPEDVAILDKDGTMHILLTTEITGAPEAIAEMREQVAEVDQLGMTAIGTALTGIMPKSLMDYIDAAEQRIKNAKGDLDQWYNFIYGGNEGIMRTLNQSMISDFDPENVAQLATYVSEVVTAIQNGQEVSQEDIDNLNKILQFVQDLDSVGVGQNVTEGIAEGMTAAGWDTSAETLATNLETAINSALIINSPSERMKPAGEYVAAGVGAGMGGYDFSTDAATLASNLETAINAALGSEALNPSGTTAMAGLAGALTAYDMTNAGTTVSANVKNAVSRSLTATSLKSIGTNAMAGLKAGINAGRSGVVSAMQSAARAAVNAAKKELKIASPSRVFRDEIGTMTMKGFGEGVLQESRVQARTIRNAARFLTGEAKEGAIAFGNNDNRKTYNQTSSVNLSGNNFYVRDEQDIRSLAIEIATLTKRQQRGRGLRMA